MDSAAIGTRANLVTTVIVAVTVFAALRQMRHNHMANELQLHLHFVNEVTTPEMRDQIEWMGEFAERLKDPEYRASLEHLAMRAKAYESKQLLRDYARLMRDPRLVALLTPAAPVERASDR